MDASMFDLELTDQSLIVHMRGIYRFLALRRRVQCPLACVREVSPEVTPELLALPLRATRKVGTRLPPRLIIGRFGTRSDGDYFFALRAGARAITIALEHGPYVALVLAVADPAGTAHAIATAAERANAAGGVPS